MAKIYNLGGKNPPRAEMPEEDDHIPFHRELGDPYTFFHEGKELTGSVKRSWKYLTLISASDGELYVEDTRKAIDKQIRQLTDADRCTHCGV